MSSICFLTFSFSLKKKSSNFYFFKSTTSCMENKTVNIRFRWIEWLYLCWLAEIQIRVVMEKTYWEQLLVPSTCSLTGTTNCYWNKTILVSPPEHMLCRVSNISLSLEIRLIKQIRLSICKRRIWSQSCQASPVWCRQETSAN